MNVILLTVYDCCETRHKEGPTLLHQVTYKEACTVKSSNCKVKKAVIKTMFYVTGFIISTIAYTVRGSLLQALASDELS
jgi:hypothetical protein